MSPRPDASISIAPAATLNTSTLTAGSTTSTNSLDDGGAAKREKRLKRALANALARAQAAEALVLEKLNAQEAAASARDSTIEEEVAGLKSELARRDEQVSNLKTRVEEVEVMFKDLLSLVQVMEKHNDMLQKRNSDLEAQVGSKGEEGEGKSGDTAKDEEETVSPERVAELEKLLMEAGALIQQLNDRNLNLTKLLEATYALANTKISTAMGEVPADDEESGDQPLNDEHDDDSNTDPDEEDPQSKEEGDVSDGPPGEDGVNGAGDDGEASLPTEKKDE